MEQRKDEFGDRIKSYEAIETSRAFDPALPIYARIDGRCFSKFTRGFKRPFDPRMTAVMVETAKHIVRETHACIGYTQSDEISLIWLTPEGGEPLFGGKVFKLTSVLASMAVAYFQRGLWDAFPEDMARDRAAAAPHFDARVFQLPNKSEAANAMLWRTLDARKNAVSMAARAYFSPKKLHGANQETMRALLKEKGVEFEDYPPAFKWGTWVRRVTFDREFTADELANIPEKHRPAPGSLVRRSEVREINMPEFRTVSNRIEVIFDGAEPITSGTAS